jgi:hypothetical protein
LTGTAHRNTVHKNSIWRLGHRRAAFTARRASQFIDRLRAFIRSRNLAYTTEKTYVHWVLRYIRFHGRKHPQTLSACHADAILSDLAVRKNCSPATQKTALNALVFLYSF